MDYLKKYYNFRANSILESVIALSIISVCIYFAILIFATVFTPKASINFYQNQNKANEIFYLIQFNKDSLLSINDSEFEIEQNITDYANEIQVKFKDSSQYKFDKKFYIQPNYE